MAHYFVALGSRRKALRRKLSSLKTHRVLTDILNEFLLDGHGFRDHQLRFEAPLVGVS